MARVCSMVLAVVFIVSLCGLATADNKADAEALVRSAVAMVQAKGLQKTLEVVNDLKGPFVKGNLYVFAMSMKNKRLAAGSSYNQKLLGTVAKNPFNAKMLEIANGPGSGWVEYSWPKPGSKQPSPKRSFIMRAPGQDAYFGCGYYVE